MTTHLQTSKPRGPELEVILEVCLLFLKRSLHAALKGITEGPHHMRDWGPVTIALQARTLIGGKKAESVQVCYTVVPVIGEIFGITCRDLNVCKSNRLHVYSFKILGYILYIPLKWSVIFVQSWTSTGHFSNSTGSFVTSCRFSPTSTLRLHEGPRSE